MRNKTSILFEKILPIFITLLVCGALYFIINKQLKEHYDQDDPKLKEIKEKFAIFFSKDIKWEKSLDMLNHRDIMQETTLYKGNKSYTINKEKVYICLKDEHENYYDNNMLVYVLAHEYSHVLCESVGHTDEFHTIFQELLIKLEEEGIYDSHLPVEEDYCLNGDPTMN